MKKILVYSFLSSVLLISNKIRSQDTTINKQKDSLALEKQTSIQNISDSYFSFPPTTKHVLGEIPTADAQKMRDYYRKNKQHFKVKYLADDGVTVIIDT